MPRIISILGEEVALLKIQCDARFVLKVQYSMNLRYFFVCIPGKYDILSSRYTRVNCHSICKKIRSLFVESDQLCCAIQMAI